MNKYKRALDSIIPEYCNDCTCLFESEICKKKLCYRPIEALKELVDRATPMKIEEIHIDEYYCPKCGEELSCEEGEVRDDFCPLCGQALCLEVKEDD